MESRAKHKASQITGASREFIQDKRRQHIKATRESEGKVAVAQRNKTFSEMNFEELVEARERQKEKNNRSAMIKYTERMLKLCDDLKLLGDLMLELADLYFDDGAFSKAEIVYSRFNTLYPGSGHTEYALYKNILCSRYAMRSADRDQTKTEETVELAREFLNNSLFTSYRTDVEGILNECYECLFESECLVCMFYANDKRKRPALKRLESIRKTILAQAPQFEQRIINFECSIAETLGDTVLLAQKQQELQERFPVEYEALITTQNTPKKRSFTLRF